MRSRLRYVLWVGLIAVGGVAAWSPLRAHLRAASLLARFAQPAKTDGIGQLGKHLVLETDASFQNDGRPIRARLYQPQDKVDAPGVVLLHGIHRLGIEEPRMVLFARVLAGSGITVFTPELSELADYRVEPKSIETIGAAVEELSRRLPGQPRVGIMGLSFAGGLGLLAAADPRYSGKVRFVVTVGAHDDLLRVLRFFATDEIERPDGTVEKMKAHEYGALVLIYSHVRDFFSADDAEPARRAIRHWLWEEQPLARTELTQLSPEGRTKLELLFRPSLAALAPELLAALPRYEQEARAVSPHGRLSGLTVPVLLLHGASDNVIPASETLWLASDVPPAALDDVLISEAIQHVELHGEPGARERWALLHFVADLLAHAEAENTVADRQAQR